eukprot:TRINITY_DN47813_c0_g1_i1.p1 TRINITY_DN47813_c0_g1~~TRINITY_DN47813_c0_g1_i1.p1  ORF type:complete len:307 (+),score=27.54 TRINITY_DN47813_c0_g1_i1:55-975(+)
MGTFLTVLLLFFCVLLGFVLAALIFIRAKLVAIEKKNATDDVGLDLKAFKEHMRSRKPANLSELPYDPSATDCLKRFKPIQNQTHCVFAKAAKLWGSDYDPELSVRENAQNHVPVFKAFVQSAPALRLDGFVFELRCLQPTTPEEFGELVQTVLWELSCGDPKQARCMSKSYINGRGWYWEFNDDSFFLTTFSPIYPSTHPRYCFDASENSSWILFQPEWNFAVQGLPPDTPHTNWDHPVTVRDKIRAGFKNNGRPYRVPPTTVYPPSEFIVLPLDVFDGSVVAWWKKKPYQVEQENEQDQKQKTA